MKEIHVECKPDEIFVLKLGFTRKFITHHPGKSRIFHKLSKSKNHLAIVDEDPGSAQTTYQKGLNLIEEYEGIMFYKDNSGNKVFVLQGKLEDWIINTCKRYKIKLSDFNLPETREELHDVINHRLARFEELMDHLIKLKNPALKKLKSWMD